MAATVDGMRRTIRIAVIAAAALLLAASAALPAQAQGDVSAIPVSCESSGSGGVPCEVRYSENPTDLLPAWRWFGTSFNLQVKAGLVVGRLSEAFSFLASVMFMAASLAWKALAELSEWSLTVDPMEAAASTVNKGFLALTDALSSSGMLWVVLFLGLVAVARMVIKGVRVALVSLLVAFLVPVGTWQAFANYMSGVDLSDPSPPLLSPAGLAIRVGDMVDSQLVAPIASGVMSLAGAGAAPAPAGGSSPGCAAYLDALRYQFRIYSGSSDTPSTAVQLRRSRSYVSSNSASSLEAVSKLWESSFLPLWADAQFGSMEAAEGLYCHQLEAQAGVSPEEQRRLARFASQLPGGEGYDQTGTLPFEVFPESLLQERTLAWAACRFDGGSWKASPGWDRLKGTGFMGATPRAVTDELCAGYFTASDAPLGGVLGGPELLSRLDFGTVDRVEAAASPLVEEGRRSEAEGIVGLVGAYYGSNTGQRLYSGLLALVTSVMYLYALGPVALGGALSKIGLVVMLMLLPGTLLLMAASAVSGRKGTGHSLMRMTLGFFVGQLVFGLVMVFILAVVSVMQKVFGVSGGVLAPLMPLVGLLLVRKALSAMGFGNITSIAGALSLPLSTAARVVREDKVSLGASRGGSRAWRWAGRADERVKGAARVGAERFARWGWERTAGAARWAKRKVAGESSEDGTPVEPGLMGKMGAVTNLTRVINEGRSTVAQWLRPVADSRFGRALRNRVTASSAYPRSVMAAHLRRYRREMLKRLQGRDAGAREAARRALHSDMLESMRRSMFGIREGDGAGTPILSASGGEAVYGWWVEDPETKTKRLVYTHEQWESLSAEEKASAVPVTSGGSVPMELAAAVTMQLARELGVDESALVSNPAAGVPPTLRPKEGGFVKARTADQTIELMRSFRVQYLPDEMKRKPQDLSDAQWAVFLNLAESYLGSVDMDGNRTDALKELWGIDVETEEGRARALAALEGGHGMRLSLPEHVYTSFLAFARGFPSLSEEAGAAREERRRHIAEMAESMAKARRLAVPKLREVEGRIREVAGFVESSQLEAAASEAGRLAAHLSDQAEALAGAWRMALEAADAVLLSVGVSTGRVGESEAVSELAARMRARQVAGKGLASELRRLAAVLRDDAAAGDAAAVRQAAERLGKSLEEVEKVTSAALEDLTGFEAREEFRRASSSRYRRAPGGRKEKVPWL